MVRAMRNIAMRLEDTLLPGTPRYKAPLPLVPQNGYVPQGLTLGPLDVREQVTKRPSANGTFDYTSLYGNRAVTAVVGLAAEMVPGGGVYDQDIEDALRAWTNPQTRCYLYWQRDTMRYERRILLRGGAASLPLQFVKSDFDIVSLAWKAPEGTSEDSLETSSQVFPSGSIEVGRSYDLTYDRTYPDSAPLGSLTIANNGNADVLPIVTIYGPCTQPRIQNVTTGLSLEFVSGLTLSSTDYLLINFKDGTVWLNGDPTNSRYSSINFSTSSWWPIVPGVNSLRFYPLSNTYPSSAVVAIRGQYI